MLPMVKLQICNVYLGKGFSARAPNAPTYPTLWYMIIPSSKIESKITRFLVLRVKDKIIRLGR